MPKLYITQRKFEYRLLNLEGKKKQNLIFILSPNKASIGKLNSQFQMTMEKMLFRDGALFITHSLEHLVLLLCLMSLKTFKILFICSLECDF